LRSLALGLSVCLAAAVALADASTPSGLAVLPFAGSGEEGSLSGLESRLAERIGAISALRVVPPAKTGARPVASLEASQVRDWAERLAVDSIVLGRTEAEADGQRVTVDLHSGHSGGPVAQHQLLVKNAEDVDRVATELAEALLGDLGVPLSAPLPGVGAPAQAAAAPQDEGSEDDGTGLFSVGSGNEPLSIDSEELELTEQGENRHLIFRRNVRVTQGDIQLLTEKLEAFYESGSSQPERLIATGQVRVLQGDRRARCDRAVYRRADQTVECTGHAELIQHCDRVRGPTIRFDLERDHVRVLGGASVLIVPESEDGTGCRKEGS
jgi:lipopolysaccharide export system protein LptA